MRRWFRWRLFVHRLFVPRFPPPLHPRWGEGELEQPILFFCFGEVFLNRGVAVRVCGHRLVNVAVVVNGWKVSLWGLCCPPLPPRPFTPAGVKGSLNSQFCFLGRIGVLLREVAMRVCLHRLGNGAVVVNGAALGAAAVAITAEAVGTTAVLLAVAQAGAAAMARAARQQACAR